MARVDDSIRDAFEDLFTDAVSAYCAAAQTGGTKRALCIFLANHFNTLAYSSTSGSASKAARCSTGALPFTFAAAPPTPPSEPYSVSASTWSVSGWLTSEGVADELSSAILGAAPGGGAPGGGAPGDAADGATVGGCDELQAMRALGGSSATVEDVELVLIVRLGAAVRPLAARLARRLRALMTVEAATGDELQSKFSQETHGMLEYGSLNTFYSGLEGLVGSPSSKVTKAMEREHTAASDSHREFTTSNYDLRTTSGVEWAFVATPDVPPAGGWPIEHKIQSALAGDEGADLAAIRASGARLRQARWIEID